MTARRLVAAALVVVVASAALLVAYLIRGDRCEEWRTEYYDSIEAMLDHTGTADAYLVAYDARPKGCTL